MTVTMVVHTAPSTDPWIKKFIFWEAVFSQTSDGGGVRLKKLYRMAAGWYASWYMDIHVYLLGSLTDYINWWLLSTVCKLTINWQSGDQYIVVTNFWKEKRKQEAGRPRSMNIGFRLKKLHRIWKAMGLRMLWDRQFWEGHAFATCY